jgi:hypothetical protein
VVALSGLAEVFAAQTIELACTRAGLADPRQMTPADLAKALPNIGRSMKIFLGEAESVRRVAELTALTR